MICVHSSHSATWRNWPTPVLQTTLWLYMCHTKVSPSSSHASFLLQNNTSIQPLWHSVREHLLFTSMMGMRAVVEECIIPPMWGGGKGSGGGMQYPCAGGGIVVEEYSIRMLVEGQWWNILSPCGEWWRNIVYACFRRGSGGGI